MFAMLGFEIQNNSLKQCTKVNIPTVGYNQ